MSRGDKQGTSRSKTISHHFKQVVTRTRVSPGFEFYFFMYDAVPYDAFPYDAFVCDAFPYDAFPYTMPLRILILFAFSSFLLVKFDSLNV